MTKNESQNKPIDVHFLGGASEVGASSSLLILGSHRILIDCGIRMGESESSSIPDLSPLNELKPHAVVLTHAHMDHSGALPLIMATIPRIPLYCTPPTAQLIRILFEDALKIMNSKGEDDIPLYSKTMVEETLNRIVEVPFDHPFPILDNQVKLTFFPAGHILGAAMTEFYSQEGRVLFTGDFAVESQITVGGTAIPKARYDLVVSESTYGSRFHPNRENEEHRLASSVAKTVANGGYVIIPAFAIGRAQEIILILSREIEHRRIPPLPVFVDGMVTKVCGVYRDFPNDVTNYLSKRIQKLSHPFFPADGTVKPVLSPKDREAVLNGPPCAIISSSGMLTGGPSVYYASELAGKAENLIAFTGYQDEESPGRKLLNLAETPLEERFLMIDRKRIQVKCSLEKISLSAHADGRQIVRFISKLNPKNVVLVHGDEQAREELWELLRPAVPDVKIHLPKSGESISLQSRKRNFNSSSKSVSADNGKSNSESDGQKGIGCGKWPESTEDVEIIYVHVLMKFPPGKFFTARELFNIYCSTSVFDAEKFEKFRTILKSSKDFFRSPKDRPFLFKAVYNDTNEKNAADNTAADKKKPAFMEQNAAIEAVKTMFSPEDRLLKVGLKLEKIPPIILLSFAFPDSAILKLAEKFQRITSLTGCPVELSPETRIEEADKYLRSILPADVKLMRALSYSRENRKVTAKVATAENVNAIMNLADTFKNETGLFLDAVSTAPSPAVSAELLSRNIHTGRMEINAALGHIKLTFAQSNETLFRASKKFDFAGEFIELAFITKHAGEKQKMLISQLSTDTGWNIRISESVHHQALMQKACELVKPHFEIIGNPSLHLISNQVEVKVHKFSKEIPSDLLQNISDNFVDYTGFQLKITEK
ncbi:MAG: MBL fold metallo-hydrolase [Candidatus Riflebacteria bacterium]|nr:MBL fold metallo-hydrolase [Candidatus Riflebacteria bacterium]